jgi:hypothetical protein
MKKTLLTILWIGILAVGVLVVIIGTIFFTEKAILTGGPLYIGILLVFVALMIRKSLLSNKAKETENVDETLNSDDRISFDVIETDLDIDNGINRQAILQNMKTLIDGGEIVEIRFQVLKSAGKSRVSITLNEHQIGFMPDDIVETYIVNKNQVDTTYFEINNEGTEFSGKYVCSVYLFLKNVKST